MRKFLVTSGDIGRDSFVWNMVGSMLMAFQSVIMLMILTRVLGLQEAGIFTIAYANANLFLTIGKYGMRNFQVSDVREQFSFYEYRTSRYITTLLMIFVSVAYVAYVGSKNGYTLEKSLIIIWMCLFKVVDVVEDIYHGFYQQKGRLDIAGKALTIRLAVTILIFAIDLIILKNLLWVLIVSTVVTFILFVILTKWGYEELINLVRKEKKFANIVELLKICFPLFLGSFLAFYIGNAPKYAIDSILNDELQACYGFIAMPVFVIGLLNNFIFNPMIYKMSVMWNEGKVKKFVKLFLLQIVVVAAITVTCIAGAYLLGIPVLSILYNTDLEPYKRELLVLLLGGGFLALSGLLTTIITIIRFQRALVTGYIIVAIMAYLYSPVLVEKYSMMGASVLYMALMVILCAIFIVILGYGLMKKGKRYEKEL